jgi:heat shock protein HslJ
MNTVKITGRVWLTAVLALSLFGCNPEHVDNVTPAPAASIQSMRASLNALEGNWVLTNYKNDPLEPAQQNRATLALSKQTDGSLRIGGRSFINLYGGTFAVDEQKGLIISTNDIISTLVGGSQADMEAEKEYLDRLSKATYFELSGANQLQIFDGQKDAPGTEVLYFTRK